jgi:hypothetical protein
VVVILFCSISPAQVLGNRQVAHAPKREEKLSQPNFQETQRQPNAPMLPKTLFLEKNFNLPL